MRTQPSSPDDDKIVPVKFHDTRHTVQLWSINLAIKCTSSRAVPVASLKYSQNQISMIMMKLILLQQHQPYTLMDKCYIHEDLWMRFLGCDMNVQHSVRMKYHAQDQ